MKDNKIVIRFFGWGVWLWCVFLETLSFVAVPLVHLYFRREDARKNANKKG